MVIFNNSSATLNITTNWYQMSKTLLTCLSTSGSRSRRYCWKCWGKEANVCLFINALKLVLTRIDPGVSMSMSSALVHFKCPVMNKQEVEIYHRLRKTHMHTHVNAHTEYTYSIICLILFLWLSEKVIHNASLIRFVSGLSYISFNILNFFNSK